MEKHQHRKSISSFCSRQETFLENCKKWEGADVGQMRGVLQDRKALTSPTGDPTSAHFPSQGLARSVVLTFNEDVKPSGRFVHCKAHGHGQEELLDWWTSLYWSSASFPGIGCREGYASYAWFVFKWCLHRQLFVCTPAPLSNFPISIHMRMILDVVSLRMVVCRKNNLNILQ